MQYQMNNDYMTSNPLKLKLKCPASKCGFISDSSDPLLDLINHLSTCHSHNQVAAMLTGAIAAYQTRVKK